MRLAAILVLTPVLVLPVRGDELGATALAPFKVQVEVYGARKEPLRRAELVARKGRAYWLLSDSNEVAVYEPAAGQVELLDLEDMQRTDLPLKRLDDAVEHWRRIRLAAAEKRHDAGGRANLIAAGMGRDLLEPKLQTAFDPSANRLKMTNTSITVDALGEPEPDAARRAFEADALTNFLKLETIRDARALPPFAALGAIRALTDEHPLRPREINFVYRLAGPPHKVRWTYALQTSLSERENASIAKIDVARERAKFLRFDRYEQEDED